MTDTCVDYVKQSAERCRDCAIRPLVFFADLRHDDFELVQHPIERLELEPGDVLYEIGAPPENLFLVRDGLVKLVRYLPNGDQRIVRLMRWGDVAGLEALAGAPYEHTAIALEPSTACRIPSKVVERFSQETPRIHHQLLLRWQRALSDADLWLTGLSTGPAHARLARLILYLVGDHPDGICYLPSREDIGAILGVTMETASRIAAEFRRSKVIERLDAKYIRVDMAKIAAIADQ